MKKNYTKMNAKIFLLIVLTALMACKKDQEKPTEKAQFVNEKASVKTTSVSSSSEIEAINVLGIVMSESEAKPAFKTGGVINKTYAKEGDLVKKGQLLATLIMSEIDAQVRQAEEGYNKTERDLARIKNLYADSVATLEQYQNAGTAVEVSKKTLEIAKFNRQYSEVRSPINGKVIKQILHDGEITGPGSPVYNIMGTGNKDWKINAGLIDRDWARVAIGDKGYISLDAYPDKKFPVSVTDKSLTGGSASSTIDIELKFDEQMAGLAAGLIGKVFIKPKKAITGNYLPVEAITYANGYTAKVFKVEGNIAREISVRIGDIKDDMVTILSGVNVGDEIITTGAIYLEDGDEITITK